MAKARQITGLLPGLPAKDAMQRILAGRIDELWSWGATVRDPKNARELHDMRIAAKRLRYCLEFFSPFLGENATLVLAKFKQIQDYLGEIHDCDVWADLLRKTLRKELKRTGQTAKGLKGHTSATEELAQVAAVLVNSGAGELETELAYLLANLATRRHELFCSFVEYWDSLNSAGFKHQLLSMVEQAATGWEQTDGN